MNLESGECCIQNRPLMAAKKKILKIKSEKKYLVNVGQ